MFTGPFAESIVKRAQEKGLVKITVHDLRNWGLDERKTVDDRPYGGGVGMILRVDVINAALKDIKTKDSKIVLLDAGGEKFNQKKAVELSKTKHLILIAGHYEGIDARVHEHLVDEVLSIGDYVLTGGEIPAMVVTDSIVRLIPRVLEKKEATELESFSERTLEYPQYTRPEKFKGWKVPQTLLSGNHKQIERWRLEEAAKRTKKVRPDLA
jgi:tRNA (guanine37-N1)-methyltransferase